MGIKKPPQHAVDAEPMYIHPSDDAWDHDRIDRENWKGQAADLVARKAAGEL